MREYDVWVVSPEGQWVQYTQEPFTAKDEAEAWVRTYIPDATYEVRTRGPDIVIWDEGGVL